MSTTAVPKLENAPASFQFTDISPIVGLHDFITSLNERIEFDAFLEDAKQQGAYDRKKGSWDEEMLVEKVLLRHLPGFTRSWTVRRDHPLSAFSSLKQLLRAGVCITLLHKSGNPIKVVDMVIVHGIGKKVVYQPIRISEVLEMPFENFLKGWRWKVTVITKNA